MFQKLCIALLLATGMVTSTAHANITPASPAMSETTYLQAITNTILTYPAQAPEILGHYAEVDITKIDVPQFMEVVNRGNYDEIYREVESFYHNRHEINKTAYQANEPSMPAGSAAATTTTTKTGITTSSVLWTAGAIAAVAAPIAVAVSGNDSDASSGTPAPGPDLDAFGREELPLLVDPATLVDTEMTNADWNNLVRENAHYGHARGLTGAGVNIGFHDVFVADPDLDPEFTGRIVFDNLDYIGDAAWCGGDPNLCEHGLRVMTRAAASKNGSGTMGFAYNANLMVNSYTLPNALPLIAAGADIINLSCINCATLSDVQTMANAGVLVVAATGNGNGPNPGANTPAQYASLLNYSMIAVSGVYDYGSGYDSTGYDKCGTQQNYCMVAFSSFGTSLAAPQVSGAAALIKEGWNFLTAQQIAQILLLSAQDIGDPGVDAIFGRGLLDVRAAMEPIDSLVGLSGSGMATPFLQSSILQNRNTAFGDAFSNAHNATGNVVVLDSFGRDFTIAMHENLNVAARPGMTPQDMDNFGRKSSFKNLQFSDRFSMQFKQEQNTDSTLDTLSVATYDIDGNANIKLGFSTDMKSLTVNEERPFERSGFISPEIFDNGFLNFSDNNQIFYQAASLKMVPGLQTTFSSFQSQNNDEDYFQASQNQFAQITSDFTTTMVETRFSPAADMKVNIKNGMTHENNSLLGTRFSGSFDMADGADTYFTGVEFSYDMATNWNLFTSYTFGATQATPSAQSAFSSVDNLTSDSFAVTATHSNLTGNDKLSLSFGQPIRVRSGTAKGLTQEVDRQTGNTRTVAFEQDLTPSGRTLLFQSAYEKHIDDRMQFNFAMEYASEPDHQQDRDDEISGMVKFVYNLN